MEAESASRTSPTPVPTRRIAQLALPALVVLAAEPLYVLVDTAVVGRLGAVSLAAVAIGGTVMSVAAWLGIVAAYGTTGRAARRFGAGDRRAAIAEGVQASWLALVAGVLLAVVGQVLAAPIAAGLAGADNPVAQAAGDWLRIAVWGAPGLLLAAAGNGWMRGVQETRRPVRYVLTANAISAVLCPILVYPAGLGLAGSAVANVVAQTLGGLLFVIALARAGVPLRPRPELIVAHLVVGRDLLIRGPPSRPASCPPPRWPPGTALSRWPGTRSPSSCGSSPRWRWTPSRSPVSPWSGPRSAPVTRRVPGRWPDDSCCSVRWPAWPSPRCSPPEPR